MSNSQPSTQSSAVRRSVEAGTRALIGKFFPSHLSLIVAVRRRLPKCLPIADELVYEYRDWFVIYSQGFASLLSG